MRLVMVAGRTSEIDSGAALLDDHVRPGARFGPRVTLPFLLSSVLRLTLLWPLLAACTSVVTPPGALESAKALSVDNNSESRTQPSYRIKAGDELDLKFFYHPDLNERLVVRPDGRISLQLVHDVAAAGRTPAELVEFLKQAYTPLIKNVEIAVIVRAISDKIFVDGEVAKPGVLDRTGPVTILQSIARAGGLKDTARSTEVLVIRRGADGRPFVIPVDVTKIVDGEDTSGDISLLPFDVVFVPKSNIANVNVWVDQYIRRNIPIYFGLTPTIF